MFKIKIQWLKKIYNKLQVKATKNLFKRGKIKKNFSVKKVGLMIEMNMNDAYDKHELEIESWENGLMYRKQNKQMLEHDLPGYKSNKTPPSSSFKPITNYSHLPKSNSCVSNCSEMIQMLI